jgi:hypothetical protein
MRWKREKGGGGMIFVQFPFLYLPLDKEHENLVLIFPSLS